MEYSNDENLLDEGNFDREVIIKGLNDSQKEAVTSPLQNMLIVAGAGTGKTRVLVSRIAWLINVEGIYPRNILAVTFTNKAANEMRERIGQMVGNTAKTQLWASTFHSVCLRLLRSYAQYADLKPGFTVLDTDAQTALVRRIMKDKNMDTKDLKPSEVACRISSLKEKGIRALEFSKSMRTRTDAFFDEVSSVYTAYERLCNQENSVDFSELLLRTVELLERNDEIRNLQHRRFKEILIDEFQDTNSIQFKFAKLMTGPDSHVLVVGDDDQSIYGWRGADYTNMKRFISEFPNVKQILLSLNYRSYQKILDMANTIINDNTDRLMEKVLKGNIGEGEDVEIINCATNSLETEFVGSTIRMLKDQGEKLSDIAILYRNNYLSLGFEQKLTQRHIPFIIYGGQKFFERAEILDALAYLRILVNEDDDTAVLRIINVPARKIGPKVVADLRAISSERHCSILKAIALLEFYANSENADKALKTLYKKVEPFYSLIKELKAFKESAPLSKLTQHMLSVTGLNDFYQAKDEKEGRSSEGNSRFGNLGVLVSNVKDFEEALNNQSLSEGEVLENALTFDDPLLTYLSNITLVSTGELNEDGSNGAPVCDAVNMMTIHSSKGLEFKYVFLVGFESGILPSSRSEGNCSEERRLAYVGITRAKKQLYITYARSRSIFGNTQISGASQFLRDIVRKYNESDSKPYIIRKA